VTGADWHWCGALVGGTLCGAAGLLNFWLTRKLLKAGPAGPLAAMVLRLVLRTTVGLGGSALAFTALGGWRAEPDGKVAFWFWVLAAYLVGLAIELALLVRPVRRLPRPKVAIETGKG